VPQSAWSQHCIIIFRAVEEMNTLSPELWPVTAAPLPLRPSLTVSLASTSDRVDEEQELALLFSLMLAQADAGAAVLIDGEVVRKRRDSLLFVVTSCSPQLSTNSGHARLPHWRLSLLACPPEAQSALRRVGAVCSPAISDKVVRKHSDLLPVIGTAVFLNLRLDLCELAPQMFSLAGAAPG
jgi:hypothetical protein